MMSGYAEYARMAERSSIKLPQSLSLADGALVEPLASSLHGVVMAALRPGAKVVVLGAGAIGLGAIFWARMSGARQVVTIARSERHKELAMQMGATHFFSQGEDLQRQVAAALGGPPEAVFECVGVPGSLSAAIELVATRGSIIVLGMCGVADPVIPFIAGMKSITMKFSAAYELRDFEAAADAIDRGAAAPRSMISETIPLRDLPLVFEQMRTTSRGCKVLVSPSE
jgi:(R,R)-butanediol dehydrogenase/meso-butanediol dehydrogenase/diacetyl reductase